jgi:hypothetical protein
MVAKSGEIITVPPCFVCYTILSWQKKHELSVGVLLFPVGFKLLTTVIIKNSIFRDIALCTSLKVNRYFGGNLSSTQERNHRDAGHERSLCFLPTSRWFLVWLVLRPSQRSRHIPPKRRSTLADYTALYAKR